MAGPVLVISIGRAKKAKNRARKRIGPKLTPTEGRKRIKEIKKDIGEENPNNPVKAGFSRKVVSDNISLLIREGRKRDEAIAISLSSARKFALKAGKRPSFLFKRKK